MSQLPDDKIIGLSDGISLMDEAGSPLGENRCAFGVLRGET